MGVDPLTREQGAPTLEANVHVGGGASLFGPIRIGAGSKIMPNAVLAQSVPPGSLVEVPPPVIRPRKPQAIPEAPPGRTELG
jgi:serine acetyltransferase